MLVSIGLPAKADHGVIEGAPLIKRYLPQDYLSSSGHNTIATDALGRIYVGNTEGLLVFDGTQWEFIEIPQRPDVRDVLLASDGKIYLAVSESFGVLNRDKNGQFLYEDLLKLSQFDTEKYHVGVVWAAIGAKDGVYFYSDDILFYVSFDRKTQKHWFLKEDARAFFIHQNQLYARIEGKGIVRFDNGTFTVVKGSEPFKNTAVAAAIDQGNWRLLVSDNGFFRLDAKGVTTLNTPNSAALKGIESYDAIRMPDGSIVIGTRNGELLYFDKTLNLKQRIKLGNFPVVELAKDLEGGLWAVTEGDIVRLVLPSAWSYFDQSEGVQGSIYDFEWHENALWMVGSTGVSRITKHHGQSKVDVFPWVDHEAFSIVTRGQDVLIGHREGLLVLDAGQSQPRHLESPAGETVYQLLASQHNPDLVYALSDHNLLILSNRPGRWQLLRKYPLDGIVPINLIELKAGELWIANQNDSQARWQIDTQTLDIKQKENFSIHKKSASEHNKTQGMYRLDNRIYVISSDKNYLFDGKAFTENKTEPFSLTLRPHEFSVAQNEHGSYAYTTREIWHREKNQTKWKILRGGLSNSAGYSNLKLTQDGVLRIATWGGILQYLPHAEKTQKKVLKLGFEYVNAISADLKTTQALPLNTTKNLAQVPAGHNLKLRFQLINLESGADFRYRLDHVSKEWSAWADRDLFIRALPPGEYTFELQAKTRAGELLTPVYYRFEVLPFWYQHLWVRVLLGLLLLCLIAWVANAMIRMRTARYRDMNLQLEAKISERTQELEVANQRLSELATEDALTGVANRRALEQGLQREWLRCLDLQQYLSAMMIDVDHFKQYNDKYGHLEGDKLLREIAQSLQFEHDTQRELFARFGGEEFVLLLPGITLEETLRRAELIRSKISKFPNNVTVSIGVAGFVPTLHLEKNSLLRRADAALYRAKRLGRNRVESDND